MIRCKFNVTDVSMDTGRHKTCQPRMATSLPAEHAEGVVGETGTAYYSTIDAERQRSSQTSRTTSA